jgi:hypothetical protein
MTAAERCLHDMVIGTCSLCQGLPDREFYSAATGSDFRDRRYRLPDVDPGRQLASFDSRCTGGSTTCQGWIKVGDTIVLEPELGAWVCQRCGDWL